MDWHFQLGALVIPSDAALYARRMSARGETFVPRGGRIIERHAVECPAGTQHYYMIEEGTTRHLVQEGGLECYLKLLDELFCAADKRAEAKKLESGEWKLR